MFREEEGTIQEYIRSLEDRIRSLEEGNKINARSWLIEENELGDLIFTAESGRIVIINKIGINTTI